MKRRVLGDYSSSEEFLLFFHLPKHLPMKTNLLRLLFRRKVVEQDWFLGASSRMSDMEHDVGFD